MVATKNISMECNEMHSLAASDPYVSTSIVAELSILFSDSGGDAGLWLGCLTSPTMENTEFAQNSLEFSCGSRKNLLYALIHQHAFELALPDQ